MIEEALRFDAAGLALEGRLAYADWLAEPQRAVLICPPHPFLGGDMDNNVVNALSSTIAEAGLPVLRFNYRGIGTSESARDLSEDQKEFWLHSTCPRYEAEIAIDCAQAFLALQGLFPVIGDYAVVGYSFGCLPALAIAAHHALSHVCLISPPLAKWPVDAARLDLPCRRGLYYAPGDFACPAERMEALYAATSGPRELRAFPNADHFFIGSEATLATAVARFLTEP